MADKTIGSLPKATALYGDSLLIAEQQGEAVAVTGELIAGFVREVAEADVQRAVDAAAAAEDSAVAAQSAADRAEAARDSMVIDEEKMAQAVSETAESAAAAQKSAESAAVSETAAIDAANRAQAEADRATVPAVAGVYNVILTDRVTAERYALIVEDGRLVLLGVSETLEATEVNLIDNATGTAYAVAVEDGRIILEEV